MNKTEYMNTLRQELMGLPSKLIEETLAFYDKKFFDGVVDGLSEMEIAAQLPHPRLVAAQKRANEKFQQLGRNFRPSNLAGLFVASIGVLIFNFFMLVPSFIYGAFLFTAYFASTAIYLAGVGILAFSLSGVPEIQFKVPGHHHRVSGHQMHQHLNTQLRDVSVNINENGVVIVNEKGGGINKENLAQKMVSVSADIKNHNDFSPHYSTVSIKNNMNGKHSFYGFALILCGTVLLLLCLMMTRLSFIGLRKYLSWNWSLLRAPLHA